MGRLKQLMPLGKGTILERAIDNLLASTVDEVIVVVGYRAEEVVAAISSKPVKIMVNPNYEEGMSTSIVAGLVLVDPKADGVMLALGDQPYVSSQTINQLVDKFYQHGKGIVVPTYQGRRGHPVILAIKYKAELLGLEGDVGAREVVKNHPQDVLEVEVEDRGVIIDIDREADLST